MNFVGRQDAILQTAIAEVARITANVQEAMLMIIKGST